MAKWTEHVEFNLYFMHPIVLENKLKKKINNHQKHNFMKIIKLTSF